MSEGLIERLEAATEGSRELDVYIQYPDEEIEIRWINDEHVKFRSGKEVDISKIPDYTTSTDSAITLIPEGWGIASLWQAFNPKDRPWWGCDLRRDEPYKLERTMAVKTLPLVICAAASKARQHED